MKKRTESIMGMAFFGPVQPPLQFFAHPPEHVFLQSPWHEPEHVCKQLLLHTIHPLGVITVLYVP